MSNEFFDLPSITPSDKEDLTLFSLPSNTSAEERRAVTALAISRLAGSSSGARECVQDVLLCFCFGIADLVGHLATSTTTNTVVVALNRDDVQAIINSQPTSSTTLNTMLQQSPPLEEALAVNSVEGVYAALASVLFAVGKQGGSGPEANSVKGRPNALVRRFGISEDDQALLPSQPCGPSAANIEAIYQSFSTFTEARMKIVQMLLSYSKKQGHVGRSIEILLNNFRMMSGAGQTHVETIIKLVHMQPWVVRVPEMNPYITKFCGELEKFQSYPLHIREYHRLLVPQSEYMFISADYKPLIAVAGSYVEDIEKTFEGYVYGKAQYDRLIQRVRSYEPSRAKYLGNTLVTRILDIPEMEPATPEPRKKDEVATIS